MFPLPCVIFAGGKSSRMGSDKALLPFAGAATLAEYQYRRLSPLFPSVYISTKSPEKFAFEAPVIPDTAADVAAPTVGFVSAFRALDAERIFVLSVDAPFVGQPVIRALLDADAKTVDAVIAKTASGTHPLCGIYHRSLQPQFETMLRKDSHRLGKLLAAANTRYVDFDDEEAFANLNHPSDYAAARRRSVPPA